jgi:hypothetical protein
MPGITENVSEKPKRGRPLVIPGQTRALYEAYGLFVEIGTERGRQDVYYRQRAIHVLRITDREASAPFRWLADIELMKGASRNGWRRTILAALGRIDDDDQLRETALVICEAKPSTRKAVAMIRRWRLGKSAGGTADGLRGELIRHLNDYLRRYPDTPWEVITEAVEGVHESVEESAGQGG